MGTSTVSGGFTIKEYKGTILAGEKIVLATKSRAVDSMFCCPLNYTRLSQSLGEVLR